MLGPSVIVIPFYQSIISDYEFVSLQQCQRVLSKHPIIAVKPQSIEMPESIGSINFLNVIDLPDHYFKSIASYNKLMLSAEFYEHFVDYKYMLIYQLDAFVFKDQLDYWCNQDYDYIGAPWIRKTYHYNNIESILTKTWYKLSKEFNLIRKYNTLKYQLQNKVGNGGFSLRKVETFKDICITMKPMIDSYLSSNSHYQNEDVFWSIEVAKYNIGFRVPDCETGLKFAFEVPPEKIRDYNIKNLPFGCHDWDKYDDYWRPIFKMYSINI